MSQPAIRLTGDHNSPLGAWEAEMNPEWISAAADMASAAEKGYNVFRNKKSEAKDEAPPPPQAPAPVASLAASSGLTNDALIMAAFIIAAAIVLAALMMHHALTA